MPLTVADFVHRWKINSQSERASAQSHFNDLCDLLGEKTPTQADPSGERYDGRVPDRLDRLYGENLGT